MSMKHVVPGAHYYEGAKYFGPVTKENLDKVKDFHFRDDDIVLSTYPKTGTVFMFTIIEAVKKRSAGGEMGPIQHLIEFSAPPEFKVSVTDVLENVPSPRFIVTHLGSSFFSHALKERNTKFIIVMRNVRDMLVSMYHFYKVHPRLGNFKGTFEEFMEMFKERDIVYGDYYDFTLGWWQYKDHPHCAFFKFEDMIKNPKEQIRRVAKVLEVELSEKDLSEIEKEIAFENSQKRMEEKEKYKYKPLKEDGAESESQEDEAKNTQAVSGDPRVHTPVKVSDHMRNGKVGDWVNYFTPELHEYIDKLHREKMSDPRAEGLQFTFLL